MDEYEIRLNVASALNFVLGHPTNPAEAEKAAAALIIELKTRGLELVHYDSIDETPRIRE